MGIVVSLVLIAAGAILTWAVTDTSSAVDLGAVGVILMVVGLVGLVLDLVLWSSWGPAYARRRVATGPAAPGYGPDYGRRTVVETPVRPARRTVVEEEEVAEGGPPGPPP